jgi:outer membrane receptor protein involved in Fe transport
VAYIDFPVNEGTETTYGGTLELEFVRKLGEERRLTAHAALSLADGEVSHRVPGEPASLIPVGGMAPVQLRLGTDIRLAQWSVAPRLAVSGRQRLAALEEGQATNLRKTLDGYATVDVNIRRRDVLKRFDLFLTVENALDARYRNINIRAYTNPEEVLGAPQNPRRITAGVQVRVAR